MTSRLPTTRRAVLTHLAAALVAGTGAFTAPAFAQAAGDYPNRPIRLIVPFAPGGGTDVNARMVAERLRTELGQPVVVDNRPGATGTIGTAAALTAPADGYTLLFTTSTNQIIAPLLMDKPPYDGAKDFTPITQIIRYLGVLLVSSSVPATNMQELIAYAKSRPGKLNYGSAGIGSTNHLLGEMLKNKTGMELVHVPYKGSAAASQALAADEIQVFFDTVPGAQNWLKLGRVKVIALASEKRSDLMPGVPTLVEQGIFDGPADYWMGLMAPPGMPPALVAKIQAATAKMMATPEMAQFAAKGGGEVAVGSPAQFQSLLAGEQRRWGDVIRRNNIRAE
ncbi:MAG: tripartite tricarboxylate transporter substrate binding protein [Burkholderiales bacterium]|nr:tripartite tricarboxylate transporter substrate binding protein [Burkholderiales bacterium]